MITENTTEPTLRSVRVGLRNAVAARAEDERLRLKNLKLSHLVSLEAQLDERLARLEAAQKAKKDLAVIAGDTTITLEQLDVVTKNVQEALYGKDNLAGTELYFAVASAPIPAARRAA